MSDWGGSRPTTAVSNADYWDEDVYWEEDQDAKPEDTHCIMWKSGLIKLPDSALAVNTHILLDCRSAPPSPF